MVSPWASMKALMSAAWRATRVGGVNCGNSVMASFSEWSRMASGWLKMRAPACMARSSSQVAVTYSKSKGGSWRISTASKAVRGRVCSGPGMYQAWSKSDTVSAWQRADTVPASQISASRWIAKTSWPRRAAARIMAMLESL